MFGGETVKPRAKEVWMDEDGYLYLVVNDPAWGLMLEAEFGYWLAHEHMQFGIWECLGKL